MGYEEELEEAQAKLERRRKSWADSKLTTQTTKDGIAPKKKQRPRPLLSVLGSNATKSGFGIEDSFKEDVGEEECDKHGTYTLIRTVIPMPFGSKPRNYLTGCVACEDEKRIDADKKHEAEEHARFIRLVGQAGVWENPGRRLADLDVHPGSAAGVAAAQALLDAESGGLYLWGPPGRGKTAIAEALGTEFCKRKWWANMWPVPILLAEEKRMMRFRDEDGYSHRLRTDRVVILDNLDGIRLTDWAVQFITAIIMQRYAQRRKLVTIITATVSPEEAFKAAGVPALVSRWKDWGPVVQLRGRDWRAS